MNKFFALALGAAVIGAMFAMSGDRQRGGTVTTISIVAVLIFLALGALT